MEEKIGQLLQKTNEKLFEAPIARQDYNNIHVKQKGKALLPWLQQVFFYFFPNFLTPPEP